MLRAAKQKEAEKLTKIAFKSKGYWGYPKEYFDIWNNELTITPKYIEKNDLFVFEQSGKVVGFYSIIEFIKEIYVSGIRIDKGFWLDHIFVTPEYIGRGIGTRLVTHLRARCKARGIPSINILADPNSKGFYEKMGCMYVMEHPSTIAGRTTPLLVLTF